MKSIIQELQMEATDPMVSVSDLLRKAKIVAVKLDLKEFEVWIEKELTGYKGAENEDLPPYRLVSGEPKAWNPYHGWQPIQFSDAETGELMRERGVIQSVGELHDLAKSDSKEFQMDYNTTAKNQIMRAIQFETDIKFMIGRSAITGILESVRNLILDWTLKLEKAGIVGEGITFSKDEKQKAHDASVTYNIGHIGNFAGAIGNVSDNATVATTQTNHVSINDVKQLLQQIRENVDEVGLTEAERVSVAQLTVGLEREVEKKQPSQPVIRSALNSLKRIFEGATGNVIAQGILFGISKLMVG